MSVFTEMFNREPTLEQLSAIYMTWDSEQAGGLRWEQLNKSGPMSEAGLQCCFCPLEGVSERRESPDGWEQKN